MMPPPSATLSPVLQTVLQELESRCHGGLVDPASLALALRHDITMDDVAPFIRFSGSNYVRSAIAKTDRWELRLLCWKPGQSTSIHGHRGSACAFRIVRGSAVESILGERDRTWTPGAIVEDFRPNLIHQVSNGSDDALLTLHAYSPALPIDAPSPRSGRNIVIVGGGFAGTALAYHLLRGGPRDLRITIVERGPWLGRGVAYGVDSSTYRLNVPASRMSIDPGIPDDFVKWSRAEKHPDAFLGRAAYGAYVVSRFGTALGASPAKVRLFRGEAVAIETGGVRTATGELLEAEAVVLATGLAPRIAMQELGTDARIIDAWDECGLATLPHDGRVLVLGAGLSALDIVSMLHARGFKGSLMVLSRNGLIPRPHLEPHSKARPLSDDVASDAPRSLRATIRWVRSVVREHERRGEPWQHGIDSLRPHLSAMWRGLPPNDRARFVRSVRPYWDVLRHRAPSDSLAILERLRSERRLEVIAGRGLVCTPSPGGLDVEFRARSGGLRKERFDAIVRCIGPALQHSEIETPLLRSLLEAGVATRDPSGLGIVTDLDGALVGGDQRSSTTVFALGAHRRASAWESTSVPDISVHAQALARRILGS